MLVLGLVIEGWPAISLRSWAVILWLAVVNSALAFTLWNRSLAVLSAASESSVINNTMLIQIAVLAWAFLGRATDAAADWRAGGRHSRGCVSASKKVNDRSPCQSIRCCRRSIDKLCHLCGCHQVPSNTL